MKRPLWAVAVLAVLWLVPTASAHHPGDEPGCQPAERQQYQPGHAYCRAQAVRQQIRGLRRVAVRIARTKMLKQPRPARLTWERRQLAAERAWWAREVKRLRKAAARRPPHYAQWIRLAECESGSRWRYNGPSGYDGALQFHPRTWTANGGRRYAPFAWGATPIEQMLVAERVLRAQGWGAWPSCSAKLGLR